MDRLTLKAELVRDECIGGKPALEAYRDSIGLWTIGVGHCLGIHKRMEQITPEESDAFLDMDIRVAEARINKLALDLDDVRQRALINMSFNLGDRLLEFSKLIAALKAKDWEEAAAQALASKWATQVGKRADRIAALIKKGAEV